MTNPTPTRRPTEEGYILVWVIFLLAVFTLAMSVAVPRIAKEIQLDRERETMERGKQYRRAIQLYYRKFHAYPPNADALVKTTGIRFLRKKYVDPITGKDDWKPILYGQNKVPTAMGFFGQPLAGSASTIAGTGPSGGNGLNGAQTIGGAGSSFGSSGSSFGSSGSSFGSSGSSFGGSSIGGSSGSSFGGSSAFGPTSGTTPGTATGTAGTTDPSSGNTSSTGLSGQSFGGAGIIGFEPASPQSSILIWKKKTHFNEWEFTYDPLSDMRTVSGNTGGIGQPASNTATPVGGTGFGSGSGGTGFGSGTTFGPSSTSPTTPTPPQ